MDFSNWLPVTIGCALAVHLAYNRFEPRAWTLHVSLLLAIPALAFGFLIHDAHIYIYALSYLLFLFTLAVSTVIYRLSPIHPLARYPGPIAARVSKLWMIYIVRTGRRHIFLKQWHDKYGPYVRIGPNELSFCDANAVNPIMGTDGMPKGPKWASRMVPNPNIPHTLLAVRSPTEHAARRKVWARAFTAGAIKEFQDAIVKRSEQLVSVLSSEASKSAVVDISHWIGCFAFDFMGDLVFSGGFELMSEEKDHEFKKLMHKNFQVGTYIEQLPWANSLFFRIPSITRDMKRFKTLAIGKAQDRHQSKVAGKDLFYHLIDEADHFPSDRKPSMGQITTDSSFAISAGADTTSSVLTSCIYSLTKNPGELKRLREEVDALFNDEDEEIVLFNSQKLADMKFMNAVINETLRLYPPVPSGSERAPYPGTGPKVFDSHVIPEGTSVNIATYALQRDPRYFAPLPDKFWPERWILADHKHDDTKTESSLSDEKADHILGSPTHGITHNMAAFIPFSYGPHNCLGMRLAMQEMRIVLALLIRNFDFAPAVGEGREDLERYEEEMQDWFAVTPGKLRIKVTPRFEKADA